MEYLEKRKKAPGIPRSLLGLSVIALKLLVIFQFLAIGLGFPITGADSIPVVHLHLPGPWQRCLPV